MEDILIPLAGMATGIILGLPIVRAVVRFVERKTSGPSSDELAAIREELRTMHDRLDSLDLDASRLTELEERVDFAERVLARQREARKLER